MRKYFSWTLTVSLLLISASVAVYIIHYLIFRDAHHIFIYMIGDIGFLFLDVLLVILLIERLLARREKRAIIKKLNMVIGTFFSEVGTELLKHFSAFVVNSSQLEKKLEFRLDWDRRDFRQAIKAAQDFSYEIKIDAADLNKLSDFLTDKRPFLLRLLENPNLLEHERFTDLLWAIFHLSEELSFRGADINNLPETDYYHLAGDLQRAYSQITSEWIAYMEHLKKSYPFLFSLATRINPMSPHPSPIVS
ncbi:MAG: hypothetical protein ACETWK_02620 [Candidatus Aminicenantaceae bacterium]